jgi:hypothetical protein
MSCFELSKKLVGRTSPAVPNIFQSLPDTLLRMRLSCNVEQPLIRRSVLDHGSSLSIYGEHHRPLAFAQMPQPSGGLAAKRGERLNIGGDVEHGDPSQAPY